MLSLLFVLASTAGHLWATLDVNYEEKGTAKDICLHCCYYYYYYYYYYSFYYYYYYCVLPECPGISKETTLGLKHNHSLPHPP